ncbi:MAG: GNAT family N-acetyltransferase [Acidimicrobiales bacterium]
MESARLATARDLPRVDDLWRQAVEELDHQRGGPLLVASLLAYDSAGPLPTQSWLRDAMTMPDRRLVVGLLDQVVVGFAAAHIDRHGREPIATVDMLHVEGPARQVGVGEAVMELVVSWAETAGVGGIDAPALPGSRPAKAFFETHGFTARLLVMHRPLRTGHQR